MRLAVSGLAWRTDEDESVARLLQRFAINAIDVVPAKYFQDLLEATDATIAEVRRAWARRGIEITGMQSLMAGTSGLNIFGTPVSQASMLEHLTAACRIGAGLGARRLVLGAPRQRDRNGLDDASAHDIACGFFSRLGDMAQGHGVVVCLEPCPVHYGANFMTDSSQAAAVVRAIAHPAIRLQFDTGALTLNDEDPEQVLAQHAGLIGHVHLSEPDLLPLGDSCTHHDRVAQALARHLPGHVASIEVLATGDAHVIALERSIRVAIQHYRTPCHEAHP